MARAIKAEPNLPLAVDEPAAVRIQARSRLLIYFSVLSAMLLSGLDQTVVSTALPRIVTDLQGADRFVWVVTAYLLCSTLSIPIYGKFSDVYGRKVMLLVAVGLFVVGSMLSGLSQTMNQLIAFRALQGLGAGGFYPLTIAIVGDLFDARQRGKYQGAIGAVFGLSFLLGPAVGGLLTEHASWHWIFYVNVPVALLAVLAVGALLPNRRLEAARARDLDYLGILLFAGGVIPLLIGLTNKSEIDSATGQTYQWTHSSVGGPILVGLVLLALFVLSETRAKHPVVPVDLFKIRNFALSLSMTFLVGLGAYVGAVFMPRFFQTVHNISPTWSGYYILPLLVGMMLGAILGGAIISRVGRYKWLLTGSLALLVIGSFLMTHLSIGTHDQLIWAWMVPLGLGVGPVITGGIVIVQSTVPVQRLGAVSGTQGFFSQIGAVMGLAIVGTVFTSTYVNQLPKSLAAHGIPAGLSPALGHLSGVLQSVGNGRAILQTVLPPPARSFIPQIVAGANDAFAQALARSFWVTLIAASAALVLSLALRDTKLPEGTKVGMS